MLLLSDLEKLYSSFPVYVFHLPNGTMEMDDLGGKYDLSYLVVLEIWIVKDDLFWP